MSYITVNLQTLESKYKAILFILNVFKKLQLKSKLLFFKQGANVKNFLMLRQNKLARLSLF